jgi:hypothetical protein
MQAGAATASTAVLSALRGKSIHFNHATVTAALAGNPHMRAVHPSVLPKMMTVPVARAVLAVRLVADGGGGPAGAGARPVASLFGHIGGLAPARTPAASRAAAGPNDARSASSEVQRLQPHGPGGD